MATARDLKPLPYRGFYFSVQKAVEDMDLSELEREAESAFDSFNMARACQGGISTKESVRFRHVQTAFTKFGRFCPSWS